jgi:hypothetical protein
MKDYDSPRFAEIKEASKARGENPDIPAVAMFITLMSMCMRSEHMGMMNHSFLMLLCKLRPDLTARDINQITVYVKALITDFENA